MMQILLILMSKLKILSTKSFPVLDDNKGLLMKQAILDAKNDGDSVGGILETAVIGLEAGIGEPWFDTVEGILSAWPILNTCSKGCCFRFRL